MQKDADKDEQIEDEIATVIEEKSGTKKKRNRKKNKNKEGLVA